MSHRPTIIDVARLAGVSISTVSRVVKGETDIVREKTRKRVYDAIEVLGYEHNAIASSLRTDQTYMIGLSIPDIASSIWAEVTRGVQDSIEASGYMVVLLNSDQDATRQRKHLQMVKRNRFDGLIINITGTSVINTELSKLNIPVVVLGDNRNMHGEFDAVGGDTRLACEMALEHLYTAGHRRIGLIGRWTHSEYESSYLAFYKDKQMLVDMNLIREGNFTEQDAFTTTQALLQHNNPPTAILTIDPVLAIGVIMAAKASRCDVPGDLSLITLGDGTNPALRYLELTTVVWPSYDIGTHSAELLLRRVSDDFSEHPTRLRLTPQLVERGSVQKR
jgi:LacI family transcriptional regulator